MVEYRTVKVSERAFRRARELQKKLEKKRELEWLGGVPLGAVFAYAVEEALKD